MKSTPGFLLHRPHQKPKHRPERARRFAEQVVPVVAPRMGVATVKLIATNAVMAGCCPLHMPLLILGPEHAATIAREGLTKEDVQRAIYEDARIPITRFGRETIERRLYRRLGHRYRNRHITPDTLVTIAQRWEDVMVIVAGGAGKHSMWVPTFGATRSVTRAILKADGSPLMPDEFN